MTRSRLAQSLRSTKHGRSLIGAARLLIDVVCSPSLGLLLVAILGERLQRSRKMRHMNVVFYPNTPHHRYMVWKVLKYMGARMALYDDVKGKQSSNDLYIRWLDATFVEPDVIDGLPIDKQNIILNGRVLDISKRHVDLVFSEVFDYGLMVDPTKYAGLCVEKSNTNGKHDGRIINCPIQHIDPEKVYQKVVHNHCEDGTVVDIRIPIIMGETPFLYLKYRPIERRFSNENTSVTIKDVSDELSCYEIERIGEFCNRMGLDLGELDVVRDSESGKIYIIDVNCTPYGPPNHLRISESRRAIHRYSAMLAARVGMTTAVR